MRKMKDLHYIIDIIDTHTQKHQTHIIVVILLPPLPPTLRALLMFFFQHPNKNPTFISPTFFLLLPPTYTLTCARVKSAHEMAKRLSEKRTSKTFFLNKYLIQYTNCFQESYARESEQRS
jgi:hypothetical protein